MVKDRLKKSLIYKGFKQELMAYYGLKIANNIWNEANEYLYDLQQAYASLDLDSKMMILPVSALYQSLYHHDPNHALSLLKDYGTKIGTKIARVIHMLTSIPGLSSLLWRNMPSLMRKTSSPKKGYQRRIVSETKELVGVDILSCPLHEVAKKIGVPEVATIVCAMDKAYMNGFKYIDYRRTTSLAKGQTCCDYRLSYNKNKK